MSVRCEQAISVHSSRSARGIHWNDYDNCEDDGNHFDCWNDDWDYDGDGATGSTTRTTARGCCELYLVLTRKWHENPYITERTHNATDIDNLDYRLTSSGELQPQLAGITTWRGLQPLRTSTRQSEDHEFNGDDLQCQLQPLVLEEWTSDGWFNTNQTVGQENMGYNGTTSSPISDT